MQDTELWPGANMAMTTRGSATSLRRERELRGWSQQHVAEAIGAPAASYVSRWERGAVSPSPYYQERLCRLFGSDAAQLGFVAAPAEVDVDVTGRATDGGPRSAAVAAHRGRRRMILGTTAVATAIVAVLAAVLAMRSSPAGSPLSASAGAPVASPAAGVGGRSWPVLTFDLHRTTETVRAAQLLLSARGLDIGATGPDGVFGSFTESAVRTFQSTSGLPTTGGVDGVTWERLVMTTALHDRGRQVEAVQRLLAATGIRPAPAINGVMGTQTQAAVLAFQSAHALRSSGEVDADTWCLLLGGAVGP